MFPTTSTTASVCWDQSNPLPTDTSQEPKLSGTKIKPARVTGVDCDGLHSATTPDSFQHFVSTLGGRKVEVLDLSKFPLDELIAPSESFRKLGCQEHMKTARVQFLQECMDDSDWKPRLEGIQARHHKLLEACSSIETFLPTIRSLAEKLAGELSSDVKTVLQNKHDSCPMESYHDGRYCENAKSKLFRPLDRYPGGIGARVLSQQSLTVPDFQSWTSSAKISKGKVLDKLLTAELVKAGFPEVNPQVFIGGVDSGYANPVAKTELFMEDSALTFTYHGQRSHLIQVLSLAEQGVLDQELLDWLVDTGIWNMCMDSDIQAYPVQVAVTSEGKEVVFHGLGAALTGQDPANLHLLLLQKKLSAAANAVAESSDMKRQQAFLKLFGLKSGTDPDELQKKLLLLKTNLSLLESYIIDSQYSGLHKAGYTGLQLDRAASFHFSRHFSDESKERVKHYLGKGHKVKVISYYPGLLTFLRPSKPVMEELTSVQECEEWLKQNSTKVMGFIVDKGLGK